MTNTQKAGMPMIRTNNTLKEKQLSSVRLYRMVFMSYIPRIVACFIVVSFILQTLARAEANEEEVTQVVITDETPHIEPALPAVIDTADVSETETTSESTTNLVSDTNEVTEESSSTSTDDSNSGAEPTESASTTVSDTDEPGEQLVEGGDGGGNTSDTEDAPAQSEVVVTDAATTSSSAVDLSVPVTTVLSDSQIQFSKSDCIAVADGSYYCQPKKPIPAATQDGFFALPDSDGDLEIYMQKGGVMTQLTHNTIDDAAPYYDAKSETLVWHRLIDDRYQIMSFDVASGEETQLTNDSVNNMEPNRAGEYTVWQHWSGDNWDIVLYDGKTAKVLTTSLEHDIAPNIRGSLVVWNRLGHDQTQTIELYDISSNEFTTISDSDGGVISNPRMVLVYESSFENGDVVTKGYDIETGEIAELATTPVEVPDTIPPVDSTGETKALIQIKPGQKEDTEVIDGNLLKPTISDPNIEPAGSTTPSISASSSVLYVATSSGLTLDLRPDTTSVPVLQNDIVLSAFTPTTTASQ